MAVKPSKKLKEEEQQQDNPGTLQEDIKPDTDSLEVDKTPLPDDIPETVVVDTKKVRIRLKKNISFHFGGENYTFIAGQAYSVPVDVKLHLNKFDVLMPL